MSEPDSKELKKKGFLKQKQPDLYSVRLRIVVGNIKPAQLRAVAEASERYGTGDVHITTRQGIEIRNVPSGNIGQLAEMLAEADLQPGSCGPRVRNIVACGGNHYCQSGITDSEDLGYAIDKYFFGRDLPGKIKIAVSGCPNSCSTPQVNDIGLVAKIKPEINDEKCDGCGACVEVCYGGAITIVDGKPKVDYKKCVYDGTCVQICPKDVWFGVPGYAMFVGGKVGKEPQLGQKLLDFIPESDREGILNVIDRVIVFFGEHAKEKERLGTLINRLSIETFKRGVLEGTNYR